jgi:protein-disulfide isomerase
MSKSKRELREQRRAAERAADVTESRRRRIRRLLGAGGVAAVLVAVAVAVSASGGAAKPVAPNGAAKVVAGITEKNGVLGDPKAPITLTEYLDPQCPICAQASQETLPTVIKKYVRTGKAKLQARTLSFIGPDSARAAKVAAGAAQQGKEWAFLETFYASQGTENSGYVTDSFLTDVANASGVNAKQALAYADTAAAQAPLDQADAEAAALKVDSTPSFTVKKGNGTETVVAVGLDNLQAKLDKALS